MNATVAPTSHYGQLAGREVHWLDWGRAEDPVVIAWHGLARTCRDMDELAIHFASRGFRVVCPDTIGRGLSQWSPVPDDEYHIAFYARLALALLDALQLTRVHWVGTSMGGSIGLAGAGGLHEPQLKTRIASLVLNDFAPKIAEAAVTRIRSYAGKPPAFDTVSELETFFRTVYKPYGWLSDAQWRRLTESSTRRLPDGRVTPHYDPAMVRQFEAHPEDFLLWPHYDAIEVPVLCLRGAESDLVLPETLAEMRLRGPGAAGRLQVIEVPGCGHAPALNVPAHLEPIEAFIRAAGA
jgi:pimeloyl-ACP methyl ester carboxylesterase